MAGLQERGNVHEPDSVARAVEEVGCYVQGEARLARASRAGQGDEPGGGDKGADLGELLLAAYERAQRARQVVGELRVVERAQGREAHVKPLCLELEDPLGAAEVFQAVGPEVFQAVGPEVLEHGARRTRVGDKGGRRRREHDLAPVGDCRHAGSPVYLEADESDRGLGRLTRMDAHANPYPFPLRPGVPGKAPLHLDGRSDAPTGRGEDSEERVALGVHLPPAVRDEGGANYAVVGGEHFGIEAPEPLQKGRRALDIGEKEGERLRCNKL